MGNFNRDNKRSGGGFNRGSGGGRSFGGGQRFGGRDDNKQMHKATCSECGTACEVPFRPTGDRPIYCSDCFSKQGGGESRPSKFGGERRERSHFEDKQVFKATCDKCGEACEVPFRPTSGKPIYCSNCFGKGGSSSGSNVQVARYDNDTAKELKLLNAKIDSLIKILAPKSLAAKVEPAKIVKPAKVVKEVKTKVVAKEKVVKKKIVKKK